MSLCMIESRLRQLKNPDELFGGINVIVLGDLLHLPPVREHQVFEQPERMVPPPLCIKNYDHILVTFYRDT